MTTLTSMSGADFDAILTDLIGDRPGKYEAFARGTGYSRTQVYRFCRFGCIPKHMVLLMEVLAERRSRGVPLPGGFELA